MITTRRIFGLTAIAASLIGMAGCDSATALDGNANGSVAFAVNRIDSGILGLGNSAPNQASADGHTVVLSSATMTISKMELRGASAGTDGSGMESGNTSSRFETGATTITIPVEGGTSREITTVVAPGTYDKFELDVAAVRLLGTYDGQPFDVTLFVNDELESHLTPPVVVTDTGAGTALTVALDLQSWFRSANGGIIDPRVVPNDAEVAATMRSNIRSSFKTEEDHDRED